MARNFKQQIQDNFEKKPTPNLDQVIDNIQVEPIEHVEIVEPIVESKQLVHVEYPRFSIFQPIPIFGHPIDNMK